MSIAFEINSLRDVALVLEIALSQALSKSLPIYSPILFESLSIFHLSFQ